VTDAAARRDELLRLCRRHVSRGRASLAELLGLGIEMRSSGARVYDESGRAYIDCGGYGVFILGHRHPAVVAAVAAQLDANPLATNVLIEPRMVEASVALAEVAPPGLEYVYLVGAGTHAVETALKLGRVNGKRTIVAMRGGFHGKTLGALSATPNPVYQGPFAPLLPAVYVDFGDAPALEEVLSSHSDCCVILEPVQGEGGVVIPPDGYLARVESLCREHEAFLVVDEIQTGLGRLGSWWGVDRDGVRPDVLLAGKNLSGGVVPAAAVIATGTSYEPFGADPGLHTSTFAGAPLAAAAATAAIHAIREEGIVERARQLGEELIAGITEVLESESPELLTEVRGRGLLIGVEFTDPSLVADFMAELLSRGVIVNHSLNAHAVMRFTPPAVLSRKDVELVLSALADTARAVVRDRGPVAVPA